eukprot:scaffold731_cov261-Pinguiococcus_pyrenoidosus.AAC.47
MIIPSCFKALGFTKLSITRYLAFREPPPQLVRLVCCFVFVSQRGVPFYWINGECGDSREDGWIEGTAAGSSIHHRSQSFVFVDKLQQSAACTFAFPRGIVPARLAAT